MRRSVEYSSSDSSADGSFTTVVDTRLGPRPLDQNATGGFGRLQQSNGATNLMVSIADEADPGTIRAFSPPELPAPASYREMRRGSASSSNSSACSEGTQIWVPPVDQKAAYHAGGQKHSQLASNSTVVGPSIGSLSARRAFEYRDLFHPLQTLPEAAAMRVSVDVHCGAHDESPADGESSPQSSVIHSVSQNASPLTIAMQSQATKLSPISAFSTGSSNNNNSNNNSNMASSSSNNNNNNNSSNSKSNSNSSNGNTSNSRFGGNGTLHEVGAAGVMFAGHLPVPFAYTNPSHISDASSSSAIAQFEIQPLPQLQFVNKLEHNSVLELRQISTSSNGSNNTNMINVDSGISNTSPETQSGSELYHPMNYHPGRQYADGLRSRAFPHIPQSMLSSIPSSASGAIVQSITSAEFVEAEQVMSMGPMGPMGQSGTVTPAGGGSGQLSFVSSQLSSQPVSPMVRRCPPSPMRSRDSTLQRPPQSILKPNASSLPAVQMQIAFKVKLFSILSTVYWVMLSFLGVLFPLAQVTSGRGDAVAYETYYVVLYVFGICFLGYVYVYLIRERDVRRKMQKATSFLRANLLNQWRTHGAHMRSGISSCQSAVDSIALQNFGEAKGDSRCANIADQSAHSRSIDNIFIRLLVVLLGLVCIVYDGLEFVHRLAADSTVFTHSYLNSTSTSASNNSRNMACSGLAFIARPLIQLCFIFIQLYFIFLSSKMRVQRYQSLARFGLSQMLACNVCIWFLALVNELADEYEKLVVYSKGTSDNRFSPCLLRRGLVGELLSRSSPYLYYCVVLYNLFAIAILLAMWHNVGKSDDRTSSRNGCSSKASREGAASGQNLPSERGLVHFFEAEEGGHSHEVEVHDENVDAQQSLTDLMPPGDATQDDGADSSSSSGMSDSDSEGTIINPNTPPSARAASLRRPQAAPTFPLLPTAVRTTPQPQSQPQSHRSMHSQMIVEQAVASAVAFTRVVNKEQLYPVRSLDCQGAHRGVFFGLFVLVITLVNIILFHVLLQKAEFVPSALAVHYVFEISVHLLSIAAMIVAFYKMQDMLYVPTGRSSRSVVSLPHSIFNDVLLAVGQTGVIILVCCNLVSLPLVFEQKSMTFYTLNAVMPSSQTALLFIGSSVVTLIQSVCQTVFIVTGLRRMSYKMLHRHEKPGRNYVTFLVLYNLSMFFVELFEMQRLLLQTFSINYYGVLFWLVIVHISIPLVVFYRLQSTLCLIRIWKSAYRFKSF